MVSIVFEPSGDEKAPCGVIFLNLLGFTTPHFCNFGIETFGSLELLCVSNPHTHRCVCELQPPLQHKVVSAHTTDEMWRAIETTHAGLVLLSMSVYG